MEIDPKTKGTQLQFNVGGKHWVKDVYGSHLYSLFLSQILLLRVWQHFGRKIPNVLADEALSTLDNIIQFLEAYIPQVTKKILTKEGQQHAQQMINEMKQAFAETSILAKKLKCRSTTN